MANNPTTNNIYRWLFDEERLRQCSSIKLGMSVEDELHYRQEAATLARNIGARLREGYKKPNNLCISTAMVFMHRFYVFHPFQKYNYRAIVPCALFLAAKVEEQPIKLEYIIKTTAMILDPKQPKLDKSDKRYEGLVKDLIKNENLLLQTIGFDLYIQHPHQMVIEWGDAMGATRDIQKLAFDLATNSLHFSTMCLRFKPQTMAVICLGVALKAKDMDGCNQKGDDKEWWKIFDPELSLQMKEKINAEFVDMVKRNKGNFARWIEKPSLETVTQQ